jgi:hypothetical protein
MPSLKTINATEKLNKGFKYIKMPMVAEFILFKANKFRNSGKMVKITAMLAIIA